MKLKGIKISREAKILFGLMCLAAAILIWVNFATQRQGGFALFGNQEATLAPSSPTETTSPVDAVTPGAVTPDGAAPVTTDPTATVDGASVLPNVDVTAVAPDGSTTSTPDATALPAETTVEATPTTEGTPTVAAALIAARDVQLAELPFLVTEAPVEAAPETTEEVVAETTRPGEQRATVNPFSPIVLAPVETPAATIAEAAPVDTSGLIDVPLNNEPPVIGTVDAGLAGSVQPIETGPIIAEGPLPEAVLPAPTVASLPRPLPTATSPVAPDILRNMSRTEVTSDPVAVVETEPQILEVPAAIREPGQVSASVAPAILAPSTASPESAEVELEPVGSLASVTEATETSTAPASNGAPLFAGASPLSSYLRNNDVRFTGYAIGPVSVGIFRSLKSANPVVVTLGQTLPETEFVLTSLQGKEAEFSYGQEKQLLTLDLRR